MLLEKGLQQPWETERKKRFTAGGDRKRGTVRTVLEQAVEVLPRVVLDVMVAVGALVVVKFGDWGDSDDVANNINDKAVFLLAILFGSYCDHQFGEFTSIRDWSSQLVESFFAAVQIHSNQLATERRSVPLADASNAQHRRFLQSSKQRQRELDADEKAPADGQTLARSFVEQAHTTLIDIELAFFQGKSPKVFSSIDTLFAFTDPRSDSLNEYKQNVSCYLRSIFGARTMPTIPQFDW